MSPVKNPTEEAIEREQSEFGAGVVVCLAKFSEHLWNETSPMSRRFKERVKMTGYTDEQNFSYGMEMWANGASDHFYDLDREKAPDPLIELADLTLDMGHGFRNEQTWTKDHWERIRVLWRESCLAVDAMLGIEADWGQW